MNNNSNENKSQEENNFLKTPQDYDPAEDLEFFRNFDAMKADFNASNKNEPQLKTETCNSSANVYNTDMMKNTINKRGVTIPLKKEEVKQNIEENKNYYDELNLRRIDIASGRFDKTVIAAFNSDDSANEYKRFFKRTVKFADEKFKTKNARKKYVIEKLRFKYWIDTEEDIFILQFHLAKTKKTRRQWGILRRALWADGKSGVYYETNKSLAKHFKMSVRTITRDMANLKKLGLFVSDVKRLLNFGKWTTKRRIILTDIGRQVAEKKWYKDREDKQIKHFKKLRTETTKWADVEEKMSFMNLRC